MRPLFGAGFAVALVVVAASNAVAQFRPPDFSGDWRPNGSDRSVSALTIVQDATAIKVTEHAHTKVFRLYGGPTLYNADGTLAAVNTKPENAAVRTSAKWTSEKLTLTIDANSGDEPSVTVDVYGLSFDGKTLTRERTTTIAGEAPTKLTTTYVK